MTEGPNILSDGTLSREELASHSVLVLGLGISGRAVARGLAGSGAKVFASDSEAVTEAEELRTLGIEVETGSHKRAGKWLAHADLVVPAPGISPRSGVLANAIAEGIPVLSEIEVASRFTNRPVVAVTGTNGKTTTSQLVGAILSEDGRNAVTCGNIGHPWITAALEHPEADVFVVEVSSFQLTFCYGFHPHVAVITNFAPDHLDWHGSMQAYRVAKSRIAARQTRSDWFVYPGSQPDLADLAPPGPHRLPFSIGVVRTGDGVWLDGRGIAARIASDVVVHAGSVESLARFGRPMVEDGLAAAAAALAFGASPDGLERALAGFSPGPHRLEHVGELDGVAFVDDAKATNPHAALAALRCFDKVVLVAGGRNKGLDLSELRTEEKRLLGVVGFGEAAGEVVAAFKGGDTPGRTAATMQEAVDAAFGMAEPGAVVLLSPACSSWDQFRNYEERGAAFREAFEALRDRRTGGPGGGASGPPGMTGGSGGEPPIHGVRTRPSFSGGPPERMTEE